jgi:hypothetical protein
MNPPAQTVPDELLGCWQRRWIEFADGTRDDSSFVVWLQLPSLMADVRLSAAALALAGRTSFSMDELLVLAESDSSSGATVCTPVVDGTATAEWSSAVGFQPVSAFPEPGLLEWSADGAVMIERAPSEAYVEEWHLLPESRGALSHSVSAEGSEFFRAGAVGVLVRDRPEPVPSVSRLTSLTDRGALEAAVDCEFSFCRLTEAVWTIESSTVPGRVGCTFH